MTLLQSLGTIPNPTYVPYHCIFKRYMYLNNVNIIPPSRNKENGWVAEVKIRYLLSGEQKQGEWSGIRKVS